MNTIYDESHNHLNIAENYYHAMLQEDFDTMASCLHPDVNFIGPLSEMRGKEPVVSAAKSLSQILSNIQIRSRFASGNQIMFAYDFIFPEPIGKLRAAVLMKFTKVQFYNSN